MKIYKSSKKINLNIIEILFKLLWIVSGFLMGC